MITSGQGQKPETENVLADVLQVLRGSSRCQTTVLAVSTTLALQSLIVKMLTGSTCECTLTADASKASLLARTVHFDLLLLEHASVETVTLFLDDLQDSNAASHGVPLIVMTDSTDARRDNTLRQLGVQHIVNPFDDELVLRQWLHCSDGATRLRPVRGLLRIDGSELGLGGMFISQTHWVSPDQMLVRFPKPVPNGKTFGFSFEALGLPRRLHGTAEIVQSSAQQTHRALQQAARILAFKGDDSRLYKTFLEHAAHLQEA